MTSRCCESRNTVHPTSRLYHFGFDVEIVTNRLIATVEYGTTVYENEQIRLAPAHRLGNVTRTHDMTGRFGPAGDDALELSFPALRGASGAPVFYNDGQYRIIGVIIGNEDREVLPIQVHSVLDEKNALMEETRFMLPVGIAVNIKHLRPMYQRLHNA